MTPRRRRPPFKRKSKPREAPEIGGMIGRMLRALVRRAGKGELEAVEQLARLESVVATALGDGVHAYRMSPAQPSWADVADVLGVKRQSAYGRFNRPALDAPSSHDVVSGEVIASS